MLIGSGDIERGMVGLAAPSETDIGDVDLDGVDQLNKEVLQLLVLVQTVVGLAFRRGRMIRLVARHGLVGGLDGFGGRLVLVELHVLLVNASIVTSGRNSYRWMDVGLLLFLCILTGLGLGRRGPGLGLDWRRGHWFLVELADSFSHVIVDLERAWVCGLECFDANATKCFVLGAKMSNEVVDQVHGHLWIGSKLDLGLLKPRLE